MSGARTHTASREPATHQVAPAVADPEPEPLLLRLQRLAGNQAIGRLLGSGRGPGVGQPLPMSTRAGLEQAFGADLGAVRLHEDSAAATTAAAAGARATTVGTDIMLSRPLATLPPDVATRLLRHEVAHVLQQTRAGLHRSTAEAAEAEAEQSAAAPAGLPTPVQHGASSDTPQHQLMTDEEILRRIAEIEERVATASVPPDELERLHAERNALEVGLARRSEASDVASAEQEGAPGIVGTIGGGLMGEWNEDPTFAMIGTDLAVSLVPLLDQVSDARDLSAHLYFLTAKEQYNRPMRWIGLVFSLIGLVPEVGSGIKSASKFVIKGVQEAIARLGDLLALVGRVVPDITDTWRLQEYLARNWSRFVAFGKEAWSGFLDQGSRLLSWGGRWFKEALERVRELSASRLDEAFAWVRRQWEQVLSQLHDRFGRRAEPGAPPLELETPLETQARLTQEVHPDWYRRPQASTPLPERTRTETPLKSLGYDKPRARRGYFTRKRPRLQSLVDTLVDLLHIEGHHAWPQYLQGLVSQTLLPLRRLEHQQVHRALENWKDGILAPWKGKYKNMGLDEIMAELHEFYSAKFPEYLPAFEEAAEETLDALVTTLK